MEDKDRKLRLQVAPNLGASLLHILLQLLNRILQRSTSIINLINNQHPLADQIRHLPQRSQIQPLRARNPGPRSLNISIRRVGQLLVQRQADGLDRDVGAARLLEERPQDARGHVTAAANGDHQLRLEVG